MDSEEIGRLLDSFVDNLPFRPDRFQFEAFAALAAGESVIVAAPTASGKTLVAEAAIHLQLAVGRRAFYTTPIKALSNQKYGDFSRIYGSGRVGLLTGDNSINGDADLVVMTTEVLRNMIYSASPSLAGLGTVILDEIHYLQDPERGPVWEEIIIHLPRDVPIVGLSATVSNAAEFTEWVATRRGPTRLVLETERPVPLEALYLLHDKHDQRGERLLPIFAQKDGRRVANSKVVRLLRQHQGRRRRFHTPRRLEVTEKLAEQGLLPAIYFIFSRVGCEDAAARIAAAGLRLTTEEEAAEIRRRTEARTAHLAPDDLTMLGYEGWLAELEAGVAPHHAGMVPAFKETVEELFAGGLVKLVFATETLSLGINMPARSVVIESLTKFNGETHELLTPSDYTQLTGRAGRRGIDQSGVAVALYSPYVPFERVAAIAGAGSVPLRSSFRPTYNMAVNLVANYPRPRAEELLGACFAQFQMTTEREVVEGNLERNRQALRDYEERAACEQGDVWAFLESVDAGEERVRSHREVMREFAGRMNAGDVLEFPDGDDASRFVLLARGRTSQPRMQLLSMRGKIKRMRAEELPVGVARAGRVPLPKPFRPNDPDFRAAVLAALGEVPLGGERLVAGVDPDVGHPVAACPESGDHVRWARRAIRLRKEIQRQERRVERLSRGLVDELAAALDMLQAWGYTDDWRLTAKGSHLRHIYNELDLLVAEAVDQELFADLDSGEFAALASAFVFEPRRDDIEREWPTARLAERGTELERLSLELADSERARKLPESRPPQPGFAALAHDWVLGATLEDLFGEDELAAGDFVRTCRQLLDLLRQLRDTFEHLADTAAAAIRSVDRGIVAAGGVG